MADFVSDKRYFLTADGRVVEDGDPEAHSLLVGEGGLLPEAEAERYGLKLKEYKAPSLLERERAGLEAVEGDPNRQEEARFRRQRIADLEAAEKAQKPAQNKARTAAPEDKG